ncbi:hypothetical protein ABH313_21810 [Chromobacterium vaccinii]|uniref:hypothetical protein n=1 Tax=Chromobacterium vaccinii TaxID=1108595 RepID=UPI00325FEA45
MTPAEIRSFRAVLSGRREDASTTLTRLQAIIKQLEIEVESAKEKLATATTQLNEFDESH